MKPHPWTIEHTLLLLIFLLACGVRLLGLGNQPLSNFEAAWALQAYDQSLGREETQQETPGPNPGYWVATSILFSTIGDNNTLARLWPALAGAVIVFLPWFFRKRIGAEAALLMAFGLAIDPGLVAISRTAGSAMPAISFGLLALGFMYQRKPIPAGILAGLAILSGPEVLSGLLGLALTYGAVLLLERFHLLSPLAEQEEGSEAELAPERPYRLALYFLIGTLLVGGTLFFMRPSGLGALATTLPAYLTGWTNPSGIPALRLPAALLVYQPLVVIFGIISAIRAWVGNHDHPREAQILSLWAVIALILAKLYPAHQVSDLAWELIPLWALAAMELARIFQATATPHNRIVSFGQVAFICVLAVFTWLNILTLGDLAQTAQGFREGILVILGAIALGVLTSLLVAFGWSREVARRGLTWGAIVILGVYMLGRLYGATQSHAGGVEELWTRAPAAGDVGLLQNTLADISEWDTGIDNALDVVVLADSPALRWLLRNWEQARFASELKIEEMPSAIITYQGQETPSLEAAYRGQDFAWEIFPAWQGILPPNLLRWLAYHTAPATRNQVILWARSDLFPGGTLESQAITP